MPTVQLAGPQLYAFMTESMLLIMLSSAREQTKHASGVWHGCVTAQQELRKQLQRKSAVTVIVSVGVAAYQKVSPCH